MMLWLTLFLFNLLLFLPSNGVSLEISLSDSKLIFLPLVNTSLWLASSSYCPTFSYLNRTYVGPTEGFVPVSAFYDPRTDTNGYIGHQASLKSIFVVFRGSKSYNNWVSDFDSLLVLYDQCKLCFIHEGFLGAARSVWDHISLELSNLRQQFSDYDIVISGHSLGGAVATVTAIEAIGRGFQNVKLVTFGSPRVGNQQLADYISSALHESIRVTHYRDPVPHLPYRDRYLHISTEWYENEKGTLRSCTGNEDPQCSDQWLFFNVNDHVVYLGMSVGCDSVSAEKELIHFSKMGISPSSLKAHAPPGISL